MRKPLVVLFCIVMMWSFLGACAKDGYKRVETRQSLFETATDNRSYIKKAAIALKPVIDSSFGRQVEGLFLQTLIETLRSEADQLNLITSQDTEFPAFMRAGDLFSNAAHADALVKTARLQGYQFLILAGVWQVEPIRKKSGVWIFHKERTYADIVVALDVYDTFTGAKLISRVEDETVKIRPDEYDALTSGMHDGITTVEETVADYGENLGGEAADAMSKAKWMASVAVVEGQIVTLATGRLAGLKDGDRLAVFEGRKIVTGQNGDKYIAPGFKLGEIRITSVEEAKARATMEQPADIQPGDIALPAR